MKKLFLIVATALLVGFGAKAQNFNVQSFLAVSSICPSNTIGITNLSSTVSTGTNQVGIVFTNLAGTRVVVNASNAPFNLLKTLELRPDREARYPILGWAGTNTLQNWQQSQYSLFIKLTGQSGANSAVTFVFAPVCDGENESTTAGDLWQVAVTANTTTPVTLVTNVPLYKWMGCKGLRLRSVTNGDADASSRVDVTQCVLTSWTP